MIARPVAVDEVEGKLAVNPFQMTQARDDLEKVLQAAGEILIEDGAPRFCGPAC